MNLVTENAIFYPDNNHYPINAWMGMTTLDQPKTLGAVIAHYKGDSHIVNANHDIFAYLTVRKDFTEEIQITPPLMGRVNVELLAFVFQILNLRYA